MKEIIIALISGLSGSLITLAITANYYSKKIYDNNIFQRIVSIVNFGCNVYNDEKKMKEIVDDKIENKPDVVYSESEPKEGEQKEGDNWMKDY